MEPQRFHNEGRSAQAGRMHGDAQPAYGGAQPVQGAPVVMPQKKPAARALTVVKNVLVGLVALVAVAMMAFTIVSVTTFDQTERSLFGYKAFIVRSDSMSATDFSAGDLILVREVAPSTLVEGDIIAFTSPNPASYGEVVTHKIRSISTDERGDLLFQTYGTTTNADDESPVSEFYVLGKYQLALPGVGSFFAFLKTVPGYVCCILLPFLVLIGFQVWNSIKLFRQYKREQADALRAERDAVAAERAEVQAMMAEVERMRRAQTRPQPQAQPRVHAQPRAQARPEPSAPAWLEAQRPSHARPRSEPRVAHSEADVPRGRHARRDADSANSRASRGGGGESQQVIS